MKKPDANWLKYAIQNGLVAGNDMLVFVNYDKTYERLKQFNLIDTEPENDKNKSKCVFDNGKS